MAAERVSSLQDAFLQHVQDCNIPLTMFLVNGIKLQGYVTYYDTYCVRLTRDGQSQLVYKHTISAINPLIPIQPSGVTADIESQS